MFDEQGGESQDYILSTTQEFRGMVKAEFPQLEVSTPRFANDKAEVAIQAADLLAWLVRRDAHNAKFKRDRSKLPESLILGEALSMPSRSIIWDDKRLEAASEFMAVTCPPLFGPGII